jgi:2'-5' RNA ligase
LLTDERKAEALRTALIITVPEAEPLVREWRMRYDNARLGVPAHVTLLFPFVPADQVDDALLSELEGLFGGRPRFSFSLPRVARFPDAAWLRPEPDQGFRDLTRLIFDRYPAYPPYGGIHDEVMPHVTVAVGDSSIQQEVEAALTPCLPISADARDVTLLVEGPSGHWQAERRFLLAP